MDRLFKSVLFWVKQHTLFVSIFVVIIVSIAVNIVFIRPFADPIKDVEVENVASAWNNSVSQIGINPLFPPQEDFHVGDVWVVVSNGANTPLIGQATRLTHLSVQDLIHQDSDNVIFPDTESRKADAEFRHITTAQDVQDDNKQTIKTTFIAFPGVTVSNQLDVKSNLSWFGTLFGTGSTLSKVREIKIPVAETYGIPTSEALARLLDWCDAEKTKLMCSDIFARKLLSFVVDSKINTRKSDGSYQCAIDIRLITRVYMAREIENNLSVKGGKVVNVAAHAVGEGANVATSTFDDNANASSEVSVKQTFQRPLVFGFRSISIQAK